MYRRHNGKLIDTMCKIVTLNSLVQLFAQIVKHQSSVLIITSTVKRFELETKFISSKSFSNILAQKCNAMGKMLVITGCINSASRTFFHYNLTLFKSSLSFLIYRNVFVKIAPKSLEPVGLTRNAASTGEMRTSGAKEFTISRTLSDKDMKTAKLQTTLQNGDLSGSD